MTSKLRESPAPERAPDAATYSPTSSREVAPSAPDWFHDALAMPFETGSVHVCGVDISYLAWGPPSGSSTVLVHGGAAHAMWWAPLAALLDPTRRVIAMDLSGHGLSGRRDAYSADLWSEEIAAVALATSDGPPTIIGHSLGGIVLSHGAQTHGHLFERIVLVDSPVWGAAPAPEGALARVSGRPQRAYPDLATAVNRFRLVPMQECANQWYVDHVAHHGLVLGTDGWRWRFDPEIFALGRGAHQLVRFSGDLDASGCPWSVVMGGRSYLAGAARRTFASRRGSPLRFVPDAAHHVMLDQPLALLENLQDLLATQP